MAKKRIDVEIGIKNKIAAGLKSVKESLKRFSNTAGRIMKGVAAGVVAAGAAVIGMGVSFLKSASSAEETRTKFEQVFSSMVESANAVADAFAEDFGLASATARKLLGDTGDLLVGFGFTEQAALELADQTNRLAADLASFTNIEGGADRASQALTKALVGETEQAKALGIVIRQDSAEFRDNVKRLVEVEGKTLLQAKALTSLKIAFSQTQKAQGDYARTSGGLANSARLLSERWKEFREQVGLALNKTGIFNQILQDAAAWIRNFGKSEALNNFVEKIGVATQAALSLIQVLASGSGDAKQAFRSLGDIVILSLVSGAQQAANLMHQGLQAAWGMFHDKAMDGFKTYAKMLVNPIFAAQKYAEFAGKASVGGEKVVKDLFDVEGTNAKLGEAIASLKDQLKNAPINVAMTARMQEKPKMVTSGMPSTGAQVGAVSESTSMLSAGDIFTMMQTGSTAKDSMISEQQKTNEKLDKLIELTGGVE